MCLCLDNLPPHRKMSHEVRKLNFMQDYINMQNLNSIEMQKRKNLETIMKNICNKNSASYNTMMNSSNSCNSIPFTFNSSIFNSNGVNMCKFNKFNECQRQGLINSENYFGARRHETMQNLTMKFTLN
jgi:hypothetical protein